MFKDTLGQPLKENDFVIFVPDGTEKFLQGRVSAFNLYSADIHSDKDYKGIWFKRVLKVPESTKLFRFTRNHKQNDSVFWCTSYSAMRLRTIKELKGSWALLDSNEEIPRNLLLSTRVLEDYPELFL